MVPVGALGPWAVQLVIYPTGSWSAGQAEVFVPQRHRLTLMSCVASTARSVRTVRAGRPKSDLVQLSDDPLIQAQSTLLLQLLPVVLVRRIEGFHRCRHFYKINGVTGLYSEICRVECRPHLPYTHHRPEYPARRATAEADDRHPQVLAMALAGCP